MLIAALLPAARLPLAAGRLSVLAATQAHRAAERAPATGVLSRRPAAVQRSRAALATEEAGRVMVVRPVQAAAKEPVVMKEPVVAPLSSSSVPPS
jgi:hypothetical protein